MVTTGAAESATATSALGYVPGLDGLRALAVVAVLGFHVSPGVLPGGFLGVSSFFTLSGFLITGLLLNELESTGRVDLRRFWARRVKRLVPASLAVTVGCLLLTLTPWTGWGKGLYDSEVAAAAVNVVNWHLISLPPTRYPGPLGPFWSLGVEEQFYAAVALAFLLLRRQPAKASRYLIGLSAAVWIGSLGTAVVVHSHHPREMFGTDVRAAELATGALLAIWARRVGRSALQSSHPWRRLLLLAGWVGLAITLAVFRWANEDQAWVLAGGFAALSLVHAAVIVGVLADGALARLLALRPFVAIGRLSYALYLVQWPIILTLRDDRLHLDGAAASMVRLAASVVGGVVLHIVVERPARERWPLGDRATIVAWLAAIAAVSGLAAVAL